MEKDKVLQEIAELTAQGNAARQILHLKLHEQRRRVAILTSAVPPSVQPLELADSDDPYAAHLQSVEEILSNLDAEFTQSQILWCCSRCLWSSEPWC